MNSWRTLTLISCAAFLVSCSGVGDPMRRFKIVEGNEAVAKLKVFVPRSSIKPENLKCGWYRGGFAQDRAQHYFRFAFTQTDLDEIKTTLNIGDEAVSGVYKDSIANLIDHRFKEGLDSWWKPPANENECKFYFGRLEGGAGCLVQFIQVNSPSIGYLSIRCG